jgi:glycosyltransferase involved in cell wall biosynthesis
MRISRPVAPVGTPGVTAVIPCYNYGHYLPQAVASVLGQRGVQVRVIIVDDHSTDDSLQVARGLAESDDRVSVVEHPVNLGHINTYNDGFARVETEFVTLVSADDLVAPGAFERATALMGAHPRVGMVYGEPVEFADAPPASDRNGPVPYTWTVFRGLEWTRLACARGRCFILSPEVVMRTAAMRQVGGYNTALPKSGDLEYWLRTAARWDVGRVNGRVQAFYRQHQSNMHVTILSTMAADLKHRTLAFRYLESADFREVSARGPALLARAKRALAREGLILAHREMDSGGSPWVAGDLRAAAVELVPDLEHDGRLAPLDAKLSRSQPSGTQRAKEAARTQLDRVRWRLWALTGVS